MSSSVASTNRRGVVATVIAMAVFLANDTLIKLVSPHVPTTQILFLRGVFATLVLFLLAYTYFGLRSAAQYWRGWSHPTVLSRALVDALATFGYITALFQMPIANATAINMAVPFFIAAGSAYLFNEAISRLRWSLVGIGFLGVLLVIQPRADGFNWFAWLCLLATLLHAVRDLITRRIPSAIPSIVVTLATSLTVTLMAALWLAAHAWVPVSFWLVVQLAAAAVCLAAGYLLMVISMRAGDLSLISPFRYSALPMALAIGYFLWGDIPNPLAWIGIFLLAATGIVLLRTR